MVIMYVMVIGMIEARSMGGGYNVCDGYSRGRNNSNISGSQQDYLVGESGIPQICLVVIWPRFN